MQNTDVIVDLLLNELIRDKSGQMLVRSKLRAVSARLDFAEVVQERILIAASEMITNQLKYAGGAGLFQVWEFHDQGGGLDLLALDYGPGIEDVDSAVRDGFSSGKTLGRGLGSIYRLSDERDLYSIHAASANGRSWHGTAVWARFFQSEIRAHRRETVQTGLFLRAYNDDVYNGDAIRLRRDRDRLSWLHLDGLGHGKSAADTVMRVEDPPEEFLPSPKVLGVVDLRLQGNGGAAGLAASLNTGAGILRFSSVGNIEARRIGPEGLEILPGSGGVLGSIHGRIREKQFVMAPGEIFFTLSDGIRSGWEERTYPGLWNCHPQLIAYFLGNELGRDNDDKSICIVKLLV